MADISLIKSRFINKAQTKITELTESLMAGFEYNGWLDDDVDDSLLLRYELERFIILLRADNNPLTEKEILTLIDFFSDWGNFNKVVLANYSTYEMVISSDTIVVQEGEYATQEALNTEIANRQTADNALSARVQTLEDNQIDPDAILPDDFYTNQEGSTVNVWNDDSRLHTHSNKTVLDGLTSTLLDALKVLQAHYDNTSVHISTAERDAWNAKIDQAALDALATVYAAKTHTHAVGDVTGLQNIINQINTDIAAMAGQDGEDGRQIELNSPDGDLIQWRYVGDDVWIDLGNFKGDTGEGFVIDERGPSSDRLDAIYDLEDESFAFLETDTGYLYFRNPEGGPANVPEGWTSGLKFLGDKGWSPNYAVVEVSASKSVFEVVDWIGGEGEKPVLNGGSNPDARWYLGPNGLTTDINQASNVRGTQGASGTGPIIGAVGTLSERDSHDGKPAGFIFQRNDVVPATIFIKNSDSLADWSDELPWQGPPGVGTPGPAGKGTTYSVNQPSHGFVAKNIVTYKEVEATPGTYSFQKWTFGEDFAGMVVSVADTNNFTIQTSGYVSGLIGVTKGATYYAQEDGSIGAAITSVKIFKATSDTTGYLIFEKKQVSSFTEVIHSDAESSLVLDLGVNHRYKITLNADLNDIVFQNASDGIDIELYIENTDNYQVFWPIEFNWPDGIDPYIQPKEYDMNGVTIVAVTRINENDYQGGYTSNQHNGRNFDDTFDETFN